jgi:hypothetical protein
VRPLDTATTPFGCGRCGNAEWVSEIDKDKVFFVIATCHAGIPIKNGYPKEHCTAHQTSHGQMSSLATTEGRLGDKLPISLNLLNRK